MPRNRMANQERIRTLSAEAVAAGRPVAWFEQFYAESAELDDVPWADQEPNPHLVRQPEVQDGNGRRALVVGCGFGDDAEWLAANGWSTTAFDIAPTAVSRARQRFPQSSVDYVTADLLDSPVEWHSAYDLVVEFFTLQVLTEPMRPAAFAALRDLLTPGGRLLVLCRRRHEQEPLPPFPWPLTESELRAGLAGLELERFETFLDETEDPPVQRLLAVASRPDGG
jgi:SAM-dependent methyltransferase